VAVTERGASPPAYDRQLSDKEQPYRNHNHNNQNGYEDKGKKIYDFMVHALPLSMQN